MKKITILSLFIIAGCVAAGQFALADTSMLSVAPSSGNKDIGSSFDVLIQLDPAGNKACIAKGVLNFGNLSCQNIALGSGVVAQTAPNCQSPSFVLGIPKCAAALQDLMAISVKGINPGQASLSFSDVSVLDSDAAVDSGSNSGTYNITAISGAASVAQQAPLSSAEVGLDNTSQEITGEETTQQEETEDILTSQEENNAETQPAALGESQFSSFFSNWIVWLIIIILLAAIVWWFISKKENGDKKENVQK
ncbi:MAG: hypothetical protein A2402_00800 [Candidatus Staskawiczbacteria bacterium RIFOXYC1_FULL_37_43]|nr:MAG: hypothetical protein A2813_00700 [Candidatus Staskawiczbacteria bacterium RIFCSPHIGHO2_01_FULL_37_17]OGZ71446.1 MAG: hypothetical protein A2891_00860 [Candidatus Staskawiczbacteria bacterium RIFCSPLOWO2_01_FULL_37_19]OGZ76160.1 MAG: hypothetical protein A2205_03870 [Candidatus Staskawiczbacteria bacterium RIFOXYA1_FULL_37_15]OGZ80128.1 MAG: hypothetical protein A2353_02590 [Candidatus Staskawiczbacteria bacterium RIFOXYB1_FULL_38_37]OGZ81766.1 MAG: hypothetical protein A2402_00800 [Cand